MPTKDKEKQQKDQQDRAITQKTDDAIAQQRAFSDQLKTIATLQPSQLPKKSRTEPSTAPAFQPIKIKKRKDWDLILAAFNAIKGMRIDEKTGALIFPSHDAAVGFFEKQASAGYAFFVAEYIDGHLSGFKMFSCGDRKFYQGTLDDIKKQLEAAMKQDPQNIKALEGLELVKEIIKKESAATLGEDNPANKMRGSLKEKRSENSLEPSPSPKGAR